jgi:hypothetical protein
VAGVSASLCDRGKVFGSRHFGIFHRQALRASNPAPTQR